MPPWPGRERSEWMFPKFRARRAGGDLDGHMAEDTLTHAVSAMPGCRATPHDVRRAFATHLQEDLGIASSRVGMVLDHAQSDLLHVTDESATTRRYTREQMLGLKAPTIDAWVEALRVAKISIELPDSETLKAMLVAENLRQRGVKDPVAEKARRAAASAKAWRGGADHSATCSSDGGHLTLPVTPVPSQLAGEIGRLARPNETPADLPVHGCDLLQRIAQGPAQGVPRVSAGGLQVGAFHLVHGVLHSIRL